MRHIAVTSSNLHSVSYDPETQVLEITFSSGATYLYQGVPDYVYRELLSVESRGLAPRANLN